jgi:hypothetical protein
MAGTGPGADAYGDVGGGQSICKFDARTEAHGPVSYAAHQAPRALAQLVGLTRRPTTLRYYHYQTTLSLRSVFVVLSP